MSDAIAGASLDDFECKNDMTQTEWNNLKLNIKEYFI